MRIPEIPFDVYNSFYAPLQEYLAQIADAAPQFVRKSSIGTTPGGRDLTLMTVTDLSAGLPEDKPALLIFANMHCHELSGPIAVLRSIKNLVENDQDLLKSRTFYFLPRINPDHAETVLHRAGFIRSRWEYSHRGNTFHQKDVNGDGLILEMRIPCPWGDWEIDPNNENHMIRRTAHSKGPFYLKMWEGVIEKWDGAMLPAEEFEGEYLDWNRCWPVGWNKSVQAGGDFPCSEPEMYAFSRFLSAHRNIFGSINYHNGWGSIMIPTIVERDDWKTFMRLGKYATEQTGYECIANGALPPFRDEHPNAGTKVAIGQADDSLYQNFGLLAFTLELGTMENSSGFRTSDIIGKHGFSDEFNPRPQIMAYQDAHPHERKAFHPWKKFNHPDFGLVEIGGVDSVGLASPSKEWLDKVVEGTYRFTKEFAYTSPLLRVVKEETTEISSGVIRLRVLLQNAGELPTNITVPGKSTTWRVAPYAELQMTDDVECLSRKYCHRLNHFDAWQSQELEWFLKIDPTKRAAVTLYVNADAAGNFKHEIPIN